MAGALLAGALVAHPAAGYAHAFGQQFVLPLPISFYLYGGAAAVAFSFVIIALVTTNRERALQYGRYDVTDWPVLAWTMRPFTTRVLRTIGAMVFLAVLLAGLIGHQASGNNLASVLVWIVAYLGLAYASALLGDFWSVVNPFRSFARFVERSKPIPYPAWLGYLPAIAGLYLFIWLELLSSNASGPRQTAIWLMVYYLVCLAGSAMFGVADWFRFGDFPSVFCGLLARLSIFERRDKRLFCRWPGVGPVSDSAGHGSLAFFILLMLSSTAFDGLHETMRWGRWIGGLPGVVDSQTVRVIVETAALFAAPFLFFAAYACAIVLMRRLTRTGLPVSVLIRRFALSLLPIALVYHFAHYFTLLLVQGQSVIALASDPFGQGWDLFGTATMFVSGFGPGARTIWNIQVAAIVGGHIASVYLAHRIALDLFPSARDATRGQLPLLVLMVGYTVLGLWILSQPLNPAG